MNILAYYSDFVPAILTMTMEYKIFNQATISNKIIRLTIRSGRVYSIQVKSHFNSSDLTIILLFDWISHLEIQRVKI